MPGVVDIDLLEDGLVELAANGCACVEVGAVPVGSDLERPFEVGGDCRVFGVDPGEALFGCLELSANACLLWFEEVEGMASA